METRGEQLSADSEAPSQPWESKPPEHMSSPSLGPFLRSQGHFLQDPSAAKGPRSLVNKLGLEGGREEPVTIASCLAASRWPSHPTPEGPVTWASRFPVSTWSGIPIVPSVLGP